MTQQQKQPSASTTTILSFLIICLLPSSTGQSIIDIFRSHNQINDNIITEPKTDRAYDFIIVGAGSGGSVLANRLSENNKWRILLIEAGGAEGMLNQIPMLVSLFQLTNINWGYKVEPQKDACLGMKNRQCPWPRGKCLGGTSTLNYMIHTRGNRVDYDIWSALGNRGWSYDEVLPYFKKSERFRVPGVRNDSAYHSSKGYLCVEHVPYHTELSTAFLDAGKELGYRVIDYNGKEQIGFSYIQVNMDHGRRCSAATAYLRVRRKNLHILINARVTKVLIDATSKRAYGIEYARDDKRKYVIRASKEVILSAGTIDSAKLLMLSGIGPRKHLEELGIPVINDLKVGYNLIEHVGFLGLTFMVNRSVGLLQSKLARPHVAFEYALHGNGLLAIPGGAEALGFARTKYAPDSRPDLELLFASGSLHSDGGLTLRKALGVTDELYEAVYRPIENQYAWSVWPIVQNPRSVGRITLRTNNYQDPPVIRPNFFEHPADIEIILEGVKRAIELSRTGPMAAYGSRVHDRKIPGCRLHKFGSDDYWRCAIRHLPSMMNHEIGTCKMGTSDDPGAVVDPQLRVHGVDKLRVVDASVMPTMPVGHVNAGIFMIGEKAADMIKRTWEGAS